MRTAAITAIAIATLIFLYFYLGDEEQPAKIVVPEDVTLRSTASGEVVGFIDDYGAQAWLGIPFAAPPEGELRWQAPQPSAAWEGVRETLAIGNLCPQFASLLSGAGQTPEPGQIAGSEDCLYLNVWAPANAAKLPVMFWIHGGGNTIGHGGSYSGARLATAHDVVLITINYRMGVFGWFSHPALATGDPLEDSGNFGTLDVVRALAWTRENIAAFGGDPDNVTVFGESAGGFDTLAMMASPLAAGLFHRAIVQSGGFGVTTMNQAQNFASEGGHDRSAMEITNALLINDGIADNTADATAHQIAMSYDEVHDYLYGKTAEDLFAVLDGGGFGMIQMPDNFGDGHVLPDMSTEEIFSNAANHNLVPIVLGTNRDEPALFMTRDPRYVENFLGFFPRLKDEDRYLRLVKYGALSWKERGVDSLANYMTTAGNSNVYTYRFDWDEEPSIMGYDLSVALGAGHGLEIAFVFGDFQGGMGLGYLYEDSPGKDALSESMMSYWAEFAYHGNPGMGRESAETPWLAWGTEGLRSIVFDTPGDKGISMMSDEVTIDSIKHAMATDPEIPTQRERCELYVSSYGWGGNLDVDEYNSFGAEGCAQFDVKELAGF